MGSCLLKALRSTLVPLVTLTAASLAASCIPVNRAASTRTTGTKSSASVVFGGSSSGSSTSTTPGASTCAHYSSGSVYHGYCMDCVTATLDLYCPGQTDPANCGPTVQSSFNSLVNGCISNTFTLGFACARTCAEGLSLDSNCECVGPVTGSSGGSSIGTGLPVSDEGLLNVGAPVSVAKIFANPIQVSSSASCNLSIELNAWIQNRTLTNPALNNYSTDNAALILNPTWLTSLGALTYSYNSSNLSNASASVGLLIDPLNPAFTSSTSKINLGSVDRYSGIETAADSGSPSSPPAVASALWGSSMGGISRDSSANLLVADPSNHRLRQIKNSDQKVYELLDGTDTGQPALDIYGVAASAGGNVFFSGTSSGIMAYCASNSDSAFCSNTSCVEKVANTIVTSPLSQFSGLSGDCTQFQRNILFGIPKAAGIDLGKAATGGAEVVYAALPEQGKILAFKATDRSAIMGSVSWNTASSTSVLTLDSGSLSPGPVALYEGMPVTLFGSREKSFTPLGTCYFDSVPAVFRRETPYFVTQLAGNKFSLAAYPSGPALTFANIPNPVSSYCEFGGTRPLGQDISSSNTLRIGYYGLANALSLYTYAPSEGLSRPMDVKVGQDGSLYVADADTGIIWKVTVGTDGLPTGWTKLITPASSGEYPPDSVVQPTAPLEINLVNPTALALAKSCSGCALPVVTGNDSILVAEGFNTDPTSQTGGQVVRVICQSSGITAGPCKSRDRGIYRMAGRFLGYVPEVGSPSPATQQFTEPTGLVVNSASWTDNSAAYLASGGRDAGLFKLNALRETPVIGVRYQITDPYSQTAVQCLRFHPSYSCDSEVTDPNKRCTCGVIDPWDPSYNKWEAIGPAEACP